MKLCYIDESGGFEPEGSKPTATPLMVIAGLIIDHANIRALTADYLHMKQASFPGSLKGTHHALDYILAEIKSTDIRADVRSGNRKQNRNAIGYLDRLLRLLESYDARIVGRVWVKQPGAPLDKISTYTYAIQDIARHFDHLLDLQNDIGLIVCDSRLHQENRQVSHSIFTQKHRQAGDDLPRLAESPMFGVSDNHVGIQLADLLAGAFLFPMACRVYCQGCTAPAHMHPNYDRLRVRYAARLRRLQHLYVDPAGHTKGGIVVSDARGQRPSRDLFTAPVAAPAPAPVAAPAPAPAAIVGPAPEAVLRPEAPAGVGDNAPDETAASRACSERAVAVIGATAARPRGARAGIAGDPF